MKSIIKYIVLGVILVLTQMFITEFVNITPLVMLTVAPILIITLPHSINYSVLLLVSMGFGLLIDIFTEGIIGINASALLMVAVLRKPIIQLTLQKNFFDNSYCIMSKDIPFKNLFLINIILCSIFLFIYLSLDSIGHNFISFNLLRFVIGLLSNVVFWVFLEYILVRQILK